MSILLKSKKKVSSRQQIAIEGVRDGVLHMPNNHYCSVLYISSINFELKSEAEQDSVIDTYQSFLNSLATPLQIVIRIREMDIDRYLANFQTRVKDELEDIYKTQVQNYTTFVRSLISTNKILARYFYVIIPFSDKDKDFDVIQEQLSLSMDIVTKGLARLGMQSRQLSSLEILDLIYSFYTPAQAKRQPLSTQTIQLLTENYL